MDAPDGKNDGCIVLVLGMHRSGTSVFTQCLVKAGLRVADDLLQTDPQINPDGFFEDARVVALNDSLLAHLGRTWMDYRPIDIGRCDAFISQWHDDALEHLRLQYPANKIAVLKDPRMCRTWPYWFEVFAEATRDVRIAHIVRAPMEVAASLKRRDVISLDYGLLLWVTYVLAAAKATARTPGSVTLTFDSVLRSPRKAVARISANLGFDLPDEVQFENVRHEAVRPLDGQERGTVSDDLYVFASEVYSALTDWAESGADRADDCLETLWSRWHELLTQFEHRWAALREVAEDLQKLSQRLVEVGELHDFAQQVVSERDRQLADLNARLDAIGKEHSHAQEVVAQRDRQLAELNEKLTTLGADYAHAQEVVAQRDRQLEEQARELQSLAAWLAAKLRRNWLGQLLGGRKR